MDLICKDKNSSPRKKLLPGLGARNKKCYRKAESMKTTLQGISSILDKFVSKTNLKNEDQKFLREIQKDLMKISLYEQYKKLDFYFICSEILRKYNI